MSCTSACRVARRPPRSRPISSAPAAANVLPANGWLAAPAIRRLRPNRTGTASQPLLATPSSPARPRPRARQRAVERPARHRPVRRRQQPGPGRRRRQHRLSRQPAVRGSVLDGEERGHLLRVRRLGHRRHRRTDCHLHAFGQRPSSGRRRGQLHHLHQHQRAADHRTECRPGELRRSPSLATRGSPISTSASSSTTRS